MGLIRGAKLNLQPLMMPRRAQMSPLLVATNIPHLVHGEMRHRSATCILLAAVSAMRHAKCKRATSRQTLIHARCASKSSVAARVIAHNADAKAHVHALRTKKFGLTDDGSQSENPLAADLHRSVRHLSDGLYSKDIHFIAELVQNAEDNEYDSGTQPSLSFEMVNTDASNTFGASGMLVIRNNERGFRHQDVEALCAVGDSTKVAGDSEQYIGEKGIGFKSVFVVSQRPHLSSNGYCFRFDEAPEQGVGYIVPEWVDEFPVHHVDGGTVLVLPLKAGKQAVVREQLEQVSPELLLFLRKLSSISCRFEGGPDLVVSKVVDDRIATLSRGDKMEPMRASCRYWVWDSQVEVPANIVEPARTGVKTRTVTLTFPLDSRTSLAGSQNVYAFLPLEITLPFPFVLNADFLLAASRERIRFDVPWNQWLLGCIPDAFVEAFTALLESGVDGDKLAAYRFIPLRRVDQSQFEKVRLQILQKLQRTPIVPTWKLSASSSEALIVSPRFAEPNKVVFIGEGFGKVAEILNKAGSLPHFLQHDRILADIEVARRFPSELKALESRPFSSSDLEKLFADETWVKQLSDALVVDLIAELWRHEPKSRVFTQYQVVPLEGGGHGRHQQEEPIYYTSDPELADGLPETLHKSGGDTPIALSCLRNSVYKGLLASDVAWQQSRPFWRCPKCRQEFASWEGSGLMTHLQSTGHAPARGGRRAFMELASPLNGWLEQIGFKPLNAEAYCREVTRAVIRRSSAEEMVAWVKALWDLQRTELSFSREALHRVLGRLPWVLEDDSVCKRSDVGRVAHMSVLIPEGAGMWARLFSPGEPLRILSSMYLDGVPDHDLEDYRNFLLDAGASDLPEMMPPQRDSQFVLPNLRTPELVGESLSLLIGWLEHLVDAPVWTNTPFSRALRGLAWVPTTKGRRQPADVLIPNQNIQDVLGDGIPFAAIDPPVSTKLANILRFRKAPSMKLISERLAVLKSEEPSTAVQEAATKVYFFLMRFQHDVAPLADLRRTFLEQNLVLSN